MSEGLVDVTAESQPGSETLAAEVSQLVVPAVKAAPGDPGLDAVGGAVGQPNIVQAGRFQVF
jgi:hypothetical protein